MRIILCFLVMAGMVFANALPVNGQAIMPAKTANPAVRQELVKRGIGLLREFGREDAQAFLGKKADSTHQAQASICDEQLRKVMNNFTPLEQKAFWRDVNGSIVDNKAAGIGYKTGYSLCGYYFGRKTYPSFSRQVGHPYSGSVNEVLAFGVDWETIERHYYPVLKKKGLLSERRYREGMQQVKDLHAWNNHPA